MQTEDLFTIKGDYSLPKLYKKGVSLHGLAQAFIITKSFQIMIYFHKNNVNKHSEK